MTAVRLLVFAIPCLGPPLHGQPVRPPEAVVSKLKHVSADDAARSLTAFVTTNRLPVAVVAEPVSNSVFVSGEAAACRRVLEILAALDAPPATILVQMTIAQVPAGFAEDVGLGGGDKWLLTAREAKLLDAAISREPNKGLCARPQLAAFENQAGFAQVGNVDVGVISRVSSRTLPNEGVVLLRADVQIGEPAARGPTLVVLQNVLVTEAVSNGGSLVLRGGRTKTTDGGSREILVVLTPERVAQK